LIYKEAKLINTGYLPLELGGIDLSQPIYIGLLTYSNQSSLEKQQFNGTVGKVMGKKDKGKGRQI
jgi:hypothetical protein